MMQVLQLSAIRCCAALLFMLVGMAHAADTNTTNANIAIAIPAGTPVLLKTLDTMASTSVKTGDHFRMETISDVVINGKVVIPAGTPASGTVIFAREVHLGTPGALDLRVDYLEMPGGHVRIKASEILRGEDNRDANMAAGLAFGLLGDLAVRGTDTVLPAGSQMQAVVALSRPATPVALVDAAAPADSKSTISGGATSNSSGAAKAASTAPDADAQPQKKDLP